MTAIEGTTKLSYESLLLWAVLHCQDKSDCKEKAITLYNCLQEGGYEKQEQISSNDKDW